MAKKPAKRQFAFLKGDRGLAKIKRVRGLGGSRRGKVAGGGGG